MMKEINKKWLCLTYLWFIIQLNVTIKFWWSVNLLMPIVPRVEHILKNCVFDNKGALILIILWIIYTE